MIFIFLSFLTIFLSLESVPDTYAQKKPLETARVAYASASATEASLWIAKEANLFEKYGLKTDIIRIRGSSTVVQALLAKEIEITQIGGTAVVDANLAGADLVVFATVIDRFVFFIFSIPEIEKVEQFKGKLLGVSRYGSISDFAVRFSLIKYGLNPDKDATILQTGGPAETLAALHVKKIQGAALTAPYQIQARKLGFRILLDVSELEAYFPFNGLVSTRLFLKSNTDKARKFLKAYIEGISYSKKNKDFSKKVLSKYTRVNDEEVLEESYEWIIRKNTLTSPYPTVKGLKTVLEIAQIKNPKARLVKPEDYIDSSLVKELDNSGFIKSLY